MSFRSFAQASLLISSLTLGSLALATSPMNEGKSIKGTVSIDATGAKTLTPGGALFVIARSATQTGGAPIAVLRIANPKFPQDFELSERNVMMPGTVFKGPMKLIARFSPNGDALDKSGPESSPSPNESYELGAKDIKIELKSKSK